MAYSEPLGEMGIDPVELSDEDLMRELRSLHRTRLDTLRHGSESALDHHLRRTAELESEYLTRHPGREVDPHRLRDSEEVEGAAGRVGPWDTGLS
ncbi:MAG TPA: DUF6158 family protein [Micromonosporaceae bacterium]|nr:DUF6158 family protein [Micromonosporaceae bacterium]